jgi:bacteriorhodopsin
MVIDKNSEKTGDWKQMTNGTKFSFSVTYILLLTTATITFIEAMRTQNPIIRHVLNLETCISIVAGYFYSIFVNKVEDSEKNKTIFGWTEITQMRYVDWCITTPMMLLTLCLVLGNNSKVPVTLSTILNVVALNYVMIAAGYMGEMKQIDRTVGDVVGYVAFFAMFFLIYYVFVMPRKCFDNYVLYGLYLGIWSIYGIAYMLDEENKNIIMNILDLTAKCLIGLGLWVYYTKIITL